MFTVSQGFKDQSIDPQRKSQTLLTLMENYCALLQPVGGGGTYGVALDPCTSLKITGTALSIECLIRPDGSITWDGEIFNFGYYSNPYGLKIDYANGNKVNFHILIGGVVKTLLSPSALPAITSGQWSHIVCTYDGANMKIFLNGNPTPWATQAQTGSIDSTSGIVQASIFSESVSTMSAHRYAGYFQHLAVYNTVLTTTQIANHFYGDQYGGYFKAIMADSPAGFWRMNSPTGVLSLDPATGLYSYPTIIDDTNNGNDFLLAVMATYSTWGIVGTGRPISAPVNQDKLLISVGQFSQRQYEGDSITGGDITVELDNRNKDWNFLKQYKKSVMGKVGKIQSGYKNGACLFNGRNQYVTVLDNDSLSFSNNIFTIEFWLKLNSATQPFEILGKISASNNEYAIYSTVNNELTFATWEFPYTGTTVYLIQGISVDLNLHHWVFMGNGSNCYIYKDGVQVGTAGKTGANMGNGTATFEMGRANPASGVYFQGYLDEVALYNYGLGVNQILAHYNASKNKTASYRLFIMNDNPVRYWRLGEVSGTTAFEEVSSPLTLNGTYTNFQTTNLIRYSEQFDNAVWDKTTWPVTILADNINAPNGTLTADKITANAGSSAHIPVQITVSSYSAGIVVTLSCYVKKGTTQYGVFGSYSDTPWHLVFWDFDLGSITSTTNATGTITPIGGGFFRITITYTRTNAGVIDYCIGPSPVSAAGAFPVWNAIGTESIYAWDCQIEQSPFATNYVKTTSATASTTDPGQTGQLGVIGLIDDGGDGEYIDRFKGIIQDFSITAKDRNVAVVRFSGKSQKTIDTVIGSSVEPVDYNQALWNPADMAWSILTSYAGLDSTASTANIDIDYTSWAAYKTACTDLIFSLNGYFTGQTVSGILRSISELTDALIFADPSGKFYFKKLHPYASNIIPERTIFSDSLAHLQGVQLDVNKGRLINSVKVWYGYFPIAGVWTDNFSKNDLASQRNYSAGIPILKEITETSVWHADLGSATSFGTYLLLRYAEPAETITFNTKRGTPIAYNQLGDEIVVSWDQADYASQVFKIYGIGVNVSDERYDVTAERLPAFMEKTYFILDDATYGLLDQIYNPIY